MRELYFSQCKGGLGAEELQTNTHWKASSLTAKIITRFKFKGRQ
jgi:hypothetical protein